MIEKIRTKIPLFVLGIIILQPLLDVLSYWLEILGYANIVPILRLVLLVIIFILSYMMASKKIVYWLFVLVVAIYWAIHCSVLFLDGAAINFYADIGMYVRFIGALALTLAMATLLIEGGNRSRLMLLKGCLVNLFIIGFVVALSHMTGLVNYAYEATELGVVGWFSNDNGQGVILVAVILFSLLYAYLRRAVVLFGLVSFMGFGLLFIHGSRVTYYSIFAITLVYLVVLIFSKVRVATRLCMAISIGVVAMASGILYQQTPMYLNKIELQVNNRRIVSQTKKSKSTPPSVTPRVNANKPGAMSYYEKYTPDLVRRFGLERVANEFDNTTDLNIIRDHRKQKNVHAKLLAEDLGISQVLFGHQYTDFMYDGVDLEPEADMVTIPFLYGIVGASLHWFTLIALVMFSIVSHLRLRIMSTTAIVALAGVSILIGAGLIGGHVAFRLNVSFYVALALALAISLSFTLITSAHVDKKGVAE